VDLADPLVFHGEADDVIAVLGRAFGGIGGSRHAVPRERHETGEHDGVGGADGPEVILGAGLVERMENGLLGGVGGRDWCLAARKFKPSSEAVLPAASPAVTTEWFCRG
jgi:hypothetical protein